MKGPLRNQEYSHSWGSLSAGLPPDQKIGRECELIVAVYLDQGLKRA